MSLAAWRMVGGVVLLAVAALIARDGGWPYGAAALVIGSLGGVAFFAGVVHHGDLELHRELPFRAAYRAASASPPVRAGALLGAGLTPIVLGIATAIAPNGEAVLGAALCAAFGILILAVGIGSRETGKWPVGR